jgi:hypothetical protein
VLRWFWGASLDFRIVIARRAEALAKAGYSLLVIREGKCAYEFPRRQRGAREAKQAVKAFA